MSIVLVAGGIARAEPQDRCAAGDSEACLVFAETAFQAKQKDTALLTAQGLCEKGEGEGCIRLALYMDKLNVSVRGGKTPAQLRERGLKLLEASCTKDAGSACGRLGKALHQGKHVKTDEKRGLELLDKGCTLKFAAACVYLASLDRDGAKGRAYLERACDAGDGPGCTALGDRDKKRAPELYVKACTAEDAAGCSKAGALQRTARQLDQAVASFEQACELGLDEACVDAGALRESGKGVVDPGKARAHFTRACDGKVGAGCLGLALLVATDRGGPRNWGRAVELAESACTMEAKGACAAAKKLAARPPDGRCSTEQQCTPLCEEKIPASCLALGEILAKPGDPDACDRAAALYQSKCDGGAGGAVCLRAGNLAVTSDRAAEHYELGCTRGDREACTLSAYLSAVTNKPEGYAALEAACRKRQRDACFWLARAMPDEKLAEAQRHLRAACGANNGRACELLAGSLEHGTSSGAPRGGGATCCDDPVMPTPAQRKREEAHAKEVATFAAKACKLGRTLACPTDELERQPPRTCRPGDLAWDY
ncbi:MAG: sel1 repeat family protein [Myxococcales bacterium]|nr:sel1 repeat family protein [Myxococcales bacterium]